jgi:DNA-binding GntR family transcriptional regulator
VTAALRGGQRAIAARVMRRHIEWAGQLAVTRLEPRLRAE